MMQKHLALFAHSLRPLASQSRRPFSRATKPGRSQHQHIGDRGIMESIKNRSEKLLRDHQNLLSHHKLESSSRPIFPKIQKVQSYLRNRNSKYYTPKLVSIGPIHYDKYLRQQGEQYKSMWAAMYLKGKCTNDRQQLYKKIEDDLSRLKELYAEDVIEHYDNEELAWIFFRDGCAVLCFLEKLSNEKPQELKIKVDELWTVHQDLLLFENQLPFQVLKLLSNANEHQLFSVINKFFIMYNMITNGVQWEENNTTSSKEIKIIVDQPTHLLHYLRTEFIKNKILHIGTNKSSKHQEMWKGLKPWYTHRNIQELNATGIQVKSNKENAMRTHIDFEKSPFFWGYLYLPEISVDDSTAPTLLNMIAFEMCPNFKNNYEIISYVVFMDSLIDNIHDVKELRKAGVLRNMLGSDNEVATLFNNISTDLVPNEEIYQAIRLKIEGHYTSKYNTWMAQAYYKYFSKPWSIVAFVAAVIAFVLTSIQTWYAFPSHKG